MAQKYKRLHKPLLLTVAAVWIGYVFIAKGIGEGVVTVALLLVMFVLVNAGL